LTEGRPPPWRKLRLVREYDFSILKVREHWMEHPHDGSGHLRVTFHPSDWVNVIAVTEQQHVVFVRQFRAGIETDTLELPGGFVNPGEDAQAAGLRELEEETGFVAKSSRMLGVFHPNPGLQSNRCSIVLAEGCVQVHSGRPDPGEDLRVELHPRHQVDRLVLGGQVDHALMLAAFYLWHLHSAPR
jgi:ADP-ribose pyrophosphatase